MTTTTTPLRLGIIGIAGRMGQELVAHAARDPLVCVVGGVVRDPGSATRSGDEIAIHPDVADLACEVDVLLDFSTPEVAVRSAHVAAGSGVPIVIGTTGLGPDHLAAIRASSQRTAIWYARNTSTGVGAILRWLPEITRALAGYDIELVEAHHRHKADAPSGTALALVEAIRAGLAVDAPSIVHGREGSSPRAPGEIGIHAVRGGGNSGEHTIIFASGEDEVRISHRAYNRGAFAAGALRAAQAIAGREPGWYGPG